MQMFPKFHFQAVHEASPSLAFALPDSVQQSYFLFLYVNEYGRTDSNFIFNSFEAILRQVSTGISSGQRSDIMAITVRIYLPLNTSF
jgi:hypothetical protein